MNSILEALVFVTSLVIQLYIWLLVAQAVLSWLIAFNVVNRSNQVVGVIGDFLYRITEPALRPIRRYMPDLGGIDLSPLVLILLLIFVQRVLVGWFPVVG